MVEYVIELLRGESVFALVHTERDGKEVLIAPTRESYSHVRKYRVKARAQKVADKYPNSRLAATYGGFIYGSKTTVAPIQSKVNRRSNYRSI